MDNLKINLILFGYLKLLSDNCLVNNLKNKTMERKDIEKDIQRIFKENKMWYDWDVNLDGSVEISVDWGDWKHDHLYLNYIMKENGYALISEVVTEEDGSDAYSSVHTFLKREF